jgi:hypothetical protein
MWRPPAARSNVASPLSLAKRRLAEAVAHIKMKNFEMARRAIGQGRQRAIQRSDHVTMQHADALLKRCEAEERAHLSKINQDIAAGAAAIDATMAHDGVTIVRDIDRSAEGAVLVSALRTADGRLVVLSEEKVG